MNVPQQSNLIRQFKKMIIYRRCAENFLVFLLQYSGLMLSTLVPHPPIIWLASGTACGFVFLRGVNVLPGIGLGSVVAYYLATHNIFLASACASIHMLQAWILLRISHHYISPTLLFLRSSMLSKFIGCSLVLTALITALLIYFCYSSWIFSHWLTWWLADFNGLIIVAFALVAWDAYFPDFAGLTIKMGSFLAGIGSICILMILFKHHSVIVMSLALLTLPFVILTSVYVGWCGVLAVTFLFALLLTLITSFSPGLSLFLQFILCTDILFGLGIALFYVNRFDIHKRVHTFS